MPKDERTIHQGVSIPVPMLDGEGNEMVDNAGRTRFSEVRTVTDPDELEELASADQLQRLTEQGAISGFVGGTTQPSKGEGAFGPEEKTTEAAITRASTKSGAKTSSKKGK